MPKDRLNYLIGLYLNKTINESQQAELSGLVANHASDDELAKMLEQAWHEGNDEGEENNSIPGTTSDNIISAILNSDSPTSRQSSLDTGSKKVRIIWLKRLAVAASVIILFSAVYVMVKPGVSSPALSTTITTTGDNEIKPGGKKAILTLSDGSKIILDSAGNGLLAKQGSADIIKLSSGELKYISNQMNNSGTLYNTMSTPVGGIYHLVLPDGSKVWLNSTSSIRYPTAFSGKERKVEITGEIYFEIAKNADQPFKVRIDLQDGEGGEVEVLGTHFNINAYGDESHVRTTLFEGSVKVNRSTGANQIKPGQQLVSGKSGQVKIINGANLEEVIAWKEGRFQFESADIKSVMRQLARWYDIDVEYKEDITPHFGGTISRNVNIIKVLEMLELTDAVSFKVEGKKVIVMPGKI